MHNAEAQPGPMAKQLMGVVEQLQSLLKLKKGVNTKDARRSMIVIPEQDVEFRMFKGSVHHKQLTMQIYDTVVHTHGSVGLDNQSLNMVAEIPIRDKWVKGNKLLANLKGKTVRVPISGTTDAPRFDMRFLTNLAGQVTQGAAQKFLQDNLGNGLNGLFGGGGAKSKPKKKSKRRRK